MGELERAREAFTRGIENDPEHIKCLQWRAEVLRDLDDDAAAVEDFRRALECIEAADESTLASWGENRRSLLLNTLNLRMQAYDARDGSGPAVAGLLADGVHAATLEPPRDGALPQPARAAHHRGEGARGAAGGGRHAPQQHGEPREPLDRAVAGDRGGLELHELLD
jgi:tetratricopeptide (TPR) repeat protein